MSASGDSRRADHAARTGEHGIALILVVWTLALLSVLAIGFVTKARTELTIVHNQLENARARAAADAGVALSILEMTQVDPQLRRPADGREHVFGFGGSQIRVGVQDEAGKIDLNAAPDDLLFGLFRTLGLDPAQATRLTDTIADWKDADDFERPSGAEAGEYRAAGLSYGPRNGPFLAVDELRLVLGMTPALFARVRPFVTVYSRSARINPLTAPAEVIASLPGVVPAQAISYAAIRSELELPQPNLLPSLMGAENYLARGALQAVTVRSEGLTPGGGRFVREAVVVLTRTPAAPFRLVSWRQGDRLDASLPMR